YIVRHDHHRDLPSFPTRRSSDLKAGRHLQSLPLPMAQFSYLLFPHQRLRKASEAESFRLAPPVLSQPDQEAAESDQGKLHTTPVEFSTCFLSFSRQFGINAVRLSRMNVETCIERYSGCAFEVRLTAIGNCIGTKPSKRRKADQVFFSGTALDLHYFNIHTIDCTQNRRRDDLFGRTAMSEPTAVQDRHPPGTEKSLVGIMR